MTSAHSSSSMIGISGFSGNSKTPRKPSSSLLMKSAENTESASDAIGLNSHKNDARSTVTSVLDLPTPSLHPVVGASDGGGHPGMFQAEKPLCRGGSSSRFFAWLDSLRTDDFVGVIALFATVILLSSLSVLVP